jgi:hypothetical protein
VVTIDVVEIIAAEAHALAAKVTMPHGEFDTPQSRTLRSAAR